jgi:hypothetical protein
MLILAVGLGSVGLSACNRDIQHRLTCDLGRPIVRANSLGDVPAHVPLTRLRKICPSARDSVGERISRDAFEHWLLLSPRQGSVLAYLWRQDSGDTVVAYLRTRSPLYQTDEGLGVGASLAELRNAYGSPTLEYNQPRLFADFVAKPGIEFVLCWAPAGGWHGDTTLSAYSVPDSARACEIDVVGETSVIRGGD